MTETNLPLIELPQKARRGRLFARGMLKGQLVLTMWVVKAMAALVADSREVPEVSMCEDTPRQRNSNENTNGLHLLRRALSSLYDINNPKALVCVTPVMAPASQRQQQPQIIRQFWQVNLPQYGF